MARAAHHAAADAFTRVAYSAAHVVADPFAAVDPGSPPRSIGTRRIAYRRYLWSLGLGVAEAMDTAQRGMGLDWPTSLELIRRSLDAARDVPGALGRERRGHRSPAAGRCRDGIDDVIAAYEEQCEAIEARGGRMILMASRALARIARSPDDYERVYDASCRRSASP